MMHAEATTAAAVSFEVADKAPALTPQSVESDRFAAIPFHDYQLARVDQSRRSLEETYALRHQVYCGERGFLSAELYPDGLESDVYDARSAHFAVYENDGQLTATVRVIEADPLWPDVSSLPIFRHCTFDKSYWTLLDNAPRVAEISRLAMSRDVIRRAAQKPKDPATAGQRMSPTVPVVLSLYKAMYHYCQRNEVTHLVAAMEKSLRRLVERFHFPFVQIGPEVDYYGPVAPYLIGLDSCTRALMLHAPSILNEFLTGLEPEHHPGNLWPEKAVSWPRPAQPARHHPQLTRHAA